MPARFPARRLCLLLIVLALAGCAPSYRPPADTLTPPDAFNYYVRVATASADRYEVTLAAERVRRDSLDFVFPAWIPGRYHPGPDRARPENFTARDGRGRPIAVRRLSGSAWRLYPPDGEEYVAISYHIIPAASDEPLAFRPQLGLHGGFAPGGALFGYLLGFEERPVTVSFDLPAGWRVATPLRPGGANRFAAPGYAVLPGTPIVVGDRVRDYKLFVQGRPHQVTVSGADPDFAPDSLLRLISETIDHGARFYGRPTYERYLFAVQFVPPDADGIGAMGQATGSAFFLPVLAGDRLREGGIGGLLLHQYLHAWYPGSFGPGALRRPDFMAPPVLEDEWLIEGAAEYYARLLPVRYGGVGRHAFYDTMGELLTLWQELDGGPRIELGALARRGGAAEMDDTARLISGGTLAAFVVDLAIRDDTHGTRGLDQLMYFLQKRTPETGYRPGAFWDEVTVALDLPADALRVLAERGSLSLEAGLSRAGLRLVERDERRRALGARLVVGSGGQFVIAGVRSGSTASSAGLREGDRVLKINETPIGPDAAVATRYALTAYILDAATGAPVTFEVLRDGEPRTLRGTVRESRSRRVTIEEIATASASALLVRSSLFRPAGDEGR